jgi:mitochondrial fission protein ELM1
MADRERMQARPAPRVPQLPSLGPAQAPVWVLEDSADDTASQAIGIAERLGLPFRRLRLSWTWFAPLTRLQRGGSLLGIAGGAMARQSFVATGAVPPQILLSTTARSAAVGRWLKGRLGARLVHCGRAPLGLLRPGMDYDLLVVPGPDTVATAANTLPVLGAPHRISPAVLKRAAAQWEDRLDHLPRPRVALLMGGPAHGGDMEPARAHALARRMARLVSGIGGSVLASTSPRTGTEASDTLAAGLGQVMHLLHRWNEPGESPFVGFLATADIVVVAGDSPGLLVEACATKLPVYAALPELAGSAHRRLAARLSELGHVRSFTGDLARWPRLPLDEAGRAAEEIRRRFSLE